MNFQPKKPSTVLKRQSSNLEKKPPEKINTNSTKSPLRADGIKTEIQDKYVQSVFLIAYLNLNKKCLLLEV